MSESLGIPSPNGHFSYTEYDKDAENKRDAEDKPLKLVLLEGVGTVKSSRGTETNQKHIFWCVSSVIGLNDHLVPLWGRISPVTFSKSVFPLAR